jgi:hypothetical protein
VVVTSSSGSRPSLSTLGEKPPKDAPLSIRTRYALEWMEERRWSLLRSTELGSVGSTAYHEMRYAALKGALLTLLESELYRPDPEESL